MITRDEYLKTLSNFENTVYCMALQDNGLLYDEEDAQLFASEREVRIECKKNAEKLLAWFDEVQPLIELGLAAQQAQKAAQDES